MASALYLQTVRVVARLAPIYIAYCWSLVYNIHCVLQ